MGSVHPLNVVEVGFFKAAIFMAYA